MNLMIILIDDVYKDSRYVMLVRTFNEVSLLIVDCINCCCDDLMTLTNQYEERGLVTLMASSLIALHAGP